MKHHVDKNVPHELNPLYELYGIVLHGGGHYSSYINIEGQWWLCNDSTVSKITTEEIETLAKKAESDSENTPYILFYRNISSEEPLPYKRFTFTMKNIFNSLIEKLPQLLDWLSEQLAEALELASPENFSKYEKAIAIMNSAKLDNSLLLDSIFEYLDSHQISLNSIKQGLEIGLIDEEFLASQVAVYIQDTAKRNLYPGQEYKARMLQLNEI